MITINGLTVFYENAIAINDISIKVERGQIVGVIGPNSAGKTTLMNTISGHILDTKLKEDRKGGTRISIFGEILFLGENIENLWPDQRVKKGIVLCRERHPVFVESDLEENLKISGFLRSRSEMAQSISFIYDIFPELPHLRKRKAGLLSGGEQQMLAIGMALMPNPTLLLLDEPLLGLSPIIQLHLIEAIEKINQQGGVTLIVAEQFARPLIPIIHRGYIVENGMLAFEGANEELYENPDARKAYFGVDYDQL